MAANTRTTTAAPLGPVLAAFLLFVLLVGGAPVAARMTYAELAPFWSAAARFLLAALMLWGIVLVRRIPLPRGRALLGAVLFGVLTVGLAFMAVSWGLAAVPAGRGAILLATMPLLTVFLAALHGVEPLTRRGLAGAFLAVGGIAVTAAGAGGGQISLPHMAAILLGAAFNAEGGVMVKRFPSSPPVVMNAIGATVGGALLAVASLVRGEPWTIPAQPRTWLALAYLVIPVTVAAFLLYLHLLRAWSASGASYGFVLAPLVTIVASGALAGEQITARLLAGAVLVLAGALIGALLPGVPRAATARDDCHDPYGRLIPDCA